MPNDEALGCLCLHALGNIDDQHHKVDNLGATDDGLDEGRVARTVHQGYLLSEHIIILQRRRIVHYALPTKYISSGF